MKVFQFVTQLEGAGAQIVAIELDKHLSRRSEVDIDTRFGYFKQAVEGGWDENRCFYSARPRWFEMPSFLRRLRTHLAGSDVVLAHTHLAGPLIAVAAAGLRKRRRPAVIFVHHGPWEDQPLSARVLDAITRRAGVYGHEVAVSPDVYNQLVGVGGRSERQVSTIFNPAPDIRLLQSNRVGLSAIELGRPYVLNIGRMTPQKNQLLLLDALSILDSRVRPILAIAGVGPGREELERRIIELSLEDDVLLLGQLSRADVGQYIDASVAVVASSVWEALPISLIEVMTYSKPILASDIEAHRFLLGDSAVFFPVRDAARLAEMLKSVTTSSDSCQRLDVDYGSLLARFDPEQVSENYMRVLLAACSDSD